MYHPVPGLWDTHEKENEQMSFNLEGRLALLFFIAKCQGKMCTVYIHTKLTLNPNVAPAHPGNLLVEATGIMFSRGPAVLRNSLVSAKVCAFCFFLSFLWSVVISASLSSLCVRLDQLAPCNVVPALHSHALCWTHSPRGWGGGHHISHKEETCVWGKCNHCHGNKDWNLWYGLFVYGKHYPCSSACVGVCVRVWGVWLSVKKKRKKTSVCEHLCFL